MKNKVVLESIKNARFYHVDWMSHVEGLAKGYQISRSQAPVIKTDCKFGKWLYNEGQKFKDYSEFKEVVFYHDKVHESLLVLVIALGEKIEKNLFNRAKIKRQKIQLNIYLEQIKNASFDLLKSLNKDISFTGSEYNILI